MVGAAGNVTHGAFLFKAEMAYLMGLRTYRFVVLPGPPFFNFLNEERDRLDTLVGVEWYGPDQLVVAVEVVNRHLFDHPGGTTGTRELVAADRFETAIRVTRPFLRERLKVTLLGSVLGERAQDGGTTSAAAWATSSARAILRLHICDGSMAWRLTEASRHDSVEGRLISRCI